MKFFFKIQGRSQGFTLVEILVAIGVFAVVVTIAVGGFVNALKTHRQATALVATNTNLSNAIEQMAREMRTGQNFSLSGSVLTFDNDKGELVGYELVDSGIIRTSLSPSQKITDSNIVVQYLNFQLIPGSNYPDRIVVSVGALPNEKGVDITPIRLQTTVSSRNF